MLKMFITNKEIHWQMIMLKKNMLTSYNCFSCNFSYNVASGVKQKLLKEYFCNREKKSLRKKGYSLDIKVIFHLLCQKQLK